MLIERANLQTMDAEIRRRAFAFNRRPGPRNNRGRVPETAGSGGGAPSFGALDPLTIFTSVPKLFYQVADLGVTIATGVSQWDDQTGNTKHAVQATGGAQPVRNVAALNGKNTITFDGVDDVLVYSTLDLPSPSVTPTWFGFVFRQLTWTVNLSVFGGGGTALTRLFMRTATPTLDGSNGTAGTNNAGATLNTFARGELGFNNNVTDYVKLGATTTTGVNMGVGDPAAGAFCIGAHNSAAGGASNMEMAAIIALAGFPSAGELVNWNAWVTGYYGAGVLV
jgi:hypothetical protein